MNSDDGNKIQQEDGSLLIRVFKKGETVRYTCTATNVAGQDNASSTVEVVGKLHKCVTFTSFNYIALIVGLLCCERVPFVILNLLENLLPHRTCQTCDYSSRNWKSDSCR